MNRQVAMGQAASSDAAFVVPALKSFGDFVIALGAVVRSRRREDDRASLGIVAGRHLHALASALDVADRLRFVGNESWSDVPAAFDVGKRGKWSAALSLLELRRCLGALDDRATLLFDRLGWRERFIAASRACRSLPNDAGNIYLAYEHVLGRAEPRGPTAPASRNMAKGTRHAVVVPGSRLAHKVLPEDVTRALCAELVERGITVSILALAGETVQLPAGLPVERLPRSFDALVSSLQAADLVISADSLSAHLAEYFHIPAFVVTPMPNTYWLPRSSLVDDAWATFSDLGPLSLWLDRRLANDRLPGCTA